MGFILIESVGPFDIFFIFFIFLYFYFWLLVFPDFRVLLYKLREKKKHEQVSCCNWWSKH